MIYIVRSKSTRWDINYIDAPTPEEAAARLRNTPREYPYGERIIESVETKHEIWGVLGFCEGCDIGITDRVIPDQEWNYTYDGENGLYMCYRCANGRT